MLLHVYTTDSKNTPLADIGKDDLDLTLKPDKTFDMSFEGDRVKLGRYVTGWLRRHDRPNVRGVPLLTVADWIMQAIQKTGGHTEVTGLDGAGMVIAVADTTMQVKGLNSTGMASAANRAAKVNKVVEYIDHGVRERAAAQLEYASNMQLEYTGQRLIES